ncbi:hypothetical protein SAMN04488129_105180 [Halomonas daqiaonensis]|uniref:Uncharacterized protein n=2 Tax=Halomonas daqiaonensis TaxID=650850 RepID=A0A1H7L5I3_9GAMM|nr:hypothetical protein SAMN04488129_105180 [Halomonas daqiaonensis]
MVVGYPTIRATANRTNLHSGQNAMIFRTLALLRSLQGAHHTVSDAQARIQQACDYRWLRRQLGQGMLGSRHTSLADGTPAVSVVLPFVATPGRRRGGRWPEAPDERERCFVEGTHACRAAGAPGYRKLESLSQGLVQGGMAVLKDAARFQYLLDQQALRLSWRRPGTLAPDLTRQLGHYLSDGAAERHGLFLLTVKVPASPPEGAPNGTWLDNCLDRYRRILPTARR